MTHHLPRAILLMILCLPLWGFDAFRKSVGDVERGNELLEQGKPKEALSHYDKAAKSQPEAAGVHYDRAAALAKLGKLDEARKALLEATQTQDRPLRAKAFYNLGNVLHQLERYDEAATAYQNALRQNPRHKASKWNLELTLKRKKQQDKDKKDDKQKDKDKDEKDDKRKDKKDKKDDKQKDKDKDEKDDKQKDKKDKDNKDDKQQQKDEKDDKQQQKDNKDDKQQQKDNKDDKQQQKKDDKRDQRKPEMQQLDQVLDALDRNDKNLQRRRARMLKRAFRPPAKDW